MIWSFEINIYYIYYALPSDQFSFLLYRERWKFFVPRVQKMHWLMGFIGSISLLMSGSGLEETLQSASAGSEK